MPLNLGNGSFHVVRILEDHECLEGDGLREMVRLFPCEKLFIEVNLVVLRVRLDSAGDRLLNRRGEAVRRLSVQLLHVLRSVVRFRRVDIFSPTTLSVSHSSVIRGHAVGVN